MSSRITVPPGQPYQAGDQFGKWTRGENCFSVFRSIRLADTEVRELSAEFGIPVTRELPEPVIVPKVAALTCKECGVRFTHCSQCGGVLLPQPMPAETVKLLRRARMLLKSHSLTGIAIEDHLREHSCEVEG